MMQSLPTPALSSIPLLPNSNRPAHTQPSTSPTRLTPPCHFATTGQLRETVTRGRAAGGERGVEGARGRRHGRIQLVPGRLLQGRRRGGAKARQRHPCLRLLVLATIRFSLEGFLRTEAWWVWMWSWGMGRVVLGRGWWYWLTGVGGGLERWSEILGPFF